MAPLTTAELETAVAIIANREQTTFDTLAEAIEANTELAVKVAKLDGREQLTFDAVEILVRLVDHMRADLDRLTRVVDALCLDSDDLDQQLRRLASQTAGIKVLKPPTLDNDAALSAWLDHPPTKADLTPDVERVLRYLLDLTDDGN